MVSRFLISLTSVLASVLTLALSACSVPPPLAPACRPWQNMNNGTVPPTHCLYFPGSLVMDPLGDVLYAVNTNADLSFGGSTLVSMDILRHERAVQCFRKYQHDDGGDDACGRVNCSSSGAALGLNATLEDTEATDAATGLPMADYDRCYCNWDLDDPNIVNCESQRFILSDQSVELGFFPGSLTYLAEDPPNWPAAADGTTLHRGLYMAVRGDPSITFVDVTRPLLPGRDSNTSPQLTMDCGAGTTTGPHTPGQPYSLIQCGNANRVQQSLDVVPVYTNDPTQGIQGYQPRYTVPPEPLDVQIDTGCVEQGFRHDRGTFLNDPAQNPKNRPPCYLDDGKTVSIGTYYQYLAASHLETGQISAYDLGQSPLSQVPPMLEDVSTALLPADSSGRRGGYGLAPRVLGDLTQPWYLTSSISGTIGTFRLASASGPRVVPGLSLSVVNQFSLAADSVRDFVFAPGGNLAFAALNTPPALAILDTSIRSTGLPPVNQVTGVVNLCLGPSRIAMTQIPRSDMGTLVQATRVYVTCYLSGQVAEVDADNAELLSIMPTGTGPLSITLNFGHSNGVLGVDPCVDPYVDDSAPPAGITCQDLANNKPNRLRLYPLGNTQPPIGPRAYVSTYLDNDIAVLDLDPRSESYRRVVSRIGVPMPKQVQ